MKKNEEIKNRLQEWENQYKTNYCYPDVCGFPSWAIDKLCEAGPKIFYTNNILEI